MKVGVAIEENTINSRLDDRFGRANYFAILTLENNEIKDTIFIENKFKDEASGAGQKLAMFLKENKVDQVIVPELGPKARVALKELEIKAFKKNIIANLEEAIENLKQNKLEIYPLEEFVLRKA